ncbi:MAG: T9SS type A sorting domain-containing protein [Ignavibacteria bacterium]|nr:T9SS type A sorting domain-containing protein [Ignavibacteria bacterium]
MKSLIFKSRAKKPSEFVSSLLLIITAFVAINVVSKAQPRPQPLPSLGWKPAASYPQPHVNTMHSAAREAVVDFGESDFSFGWNWAAPFSVLGQRFQARRWHASDFFDPNAANPPMEPDDMQRVFLDTYFPGIQFVSVVRGMSDATAHGQPLTSNPSEAPAMEFAPWLNFNTTTNDVDLEATDATGSVFGFTDHSRGTRTGNGDAAPYAWRLARDTGAHANPDLVLDRPTQDSMMRTWWPNRNQNGIDNSALNSLILRVAVTLRRTEADPAGSTANDVILRVRLPYAIGTNAIPSNTANRTRYIEFNRLPANVPPPLHNPGTYTVGGGQIPQARLSLQAFNVLDTQLHVTEFLIRRNMLPPLNDQNGEVVTLWAEFLCDSGAAPNNTDRHNVLTRLSSGMTADGDRMSHLGIEVYHNQDETTGLGVDIRSIRIETPHATRVLFGDLDDQIQESVNTYIDRVINRLNSDEDTNHYTTPVGVNGNPPVRIWRFYGRDEAEVMHWLVFRRINILLDTTLITEVGTHDAVKQQHCLLQTTFWQGSGFNTSSDIAGYAIQRGYDRGGAMPFQPNQNETPEAYAARLAPWLERDVRQRAGLKYGLVNLRYPKQGNQWPTPLLSDAPNTTWSYQDDPETFLEFRPKGSVLKTLPVGADSLPMLLEDVIGHNGGIQASLEAMLRLSFLKEPSLLFGQNFGRPGRYQPWISNVWPQMYLRTLAGQTSDQVQYHWAAYSNNRAKSGPEMRLSYWMPLVLGAKGLMVYKGIAGTEDGGVLPADPTTADRFRGTEEFLRNYESGVQWTPPLVAAGIFNGQTADQILADEAFGADYLLQNDPSNAQEYLMNDPNNPNTGLQEVVLRLNNNVAPPGGVSRIYMGMRALRQTLAEVSDKVEDMRMSLGRDPIEQNPQPPQPPHPLTALRLQGWWGKGFGVIKLEHPNNPGCLNRIFDTTSLKSTNPNILARLRTRHPRRILDKVDSVNAPGHFNYEAYDSMFVDLTLHAIAGQESMVDRFVIGVVNRRTDPRMMAHGQLFNTADSAQWNFVTHNDWLDSVEAHPEDRYAQRGARDVTIPFSYEHIDGNYRLLRIRELGGGIDTVIGQDRELTVRLLPGEGKMMQVDVVPAEASNVARGWLDHNTQRKLVVFPTANGIDTVVRTRPSHGPGPCQDTSVIVMRHGTTLRYHMVYHRRVNPDPTPGLNQLSVFYRRSYPLTAQGGSDNTFAHGGDVTWEDEIRLSNTIVPAPNLPEDPSCGYPSLVVRYDPMRQRSMVYVVYACEQTTPNAPDIAICEAQLWADAPTRAIQDNDYRTVELGSRRLDEVRSSPNGNCLEAYQVSTRLAFWGTPVINASHGGNYYAWSDYIRGIVYGYKQPHERAFVLPALDAVRLTPNTESKPMYPTLNSYSRLEIGERDCALAWQDGSPTSFDCAFGSAIYYTHLRTDTGQVFRELSYSTTQNVTGLIRVDNNRVVRVYQANVNDYNGKPTLYRSLTDYDQASYNNSGMFVDTIGQVNHKADRIAWMTRIRTMPGNPVQGWGATMIARRAIDGLERSRCDTVDTTKLWGNAPGFIFSTAPLENPELTMGEQKTERRGAPVAESWAHDDTCMIMSFDQLPVQGAADGFLQELQFGWDLMSMPGTVPLWDPILQQKAIVRQMAERGRHHHTSAKHSIARSYGLTTGRRIYDHTPFIDAGHSQAPTIGRSSEGFFKLTDGNMQASGERTARSYRGFRSDNFDALLAPLVVDGEELALTYAAETDLKTKTGQPKRIVSGWFSIPEICEVGIGSIATGESAYLAGAFLERQSDGARLDLNVFAPANTNMRSTPNKSTKFAWTFVSSKDEQYRLMIETDDEEALVATDIDIDPIPNVKSFGKSLSQNPVVDLRNMRVLGQRGGGTEAGRIEVIPSPANDKATVIVSATDVKSLGGELIITDLSGREVMRTEVTARNTSVAVIDINTAPLLSGLYNVTIGTSGIRGVLIVAR